MNAKAPTSPPVAKPDCFCAKEGHAYGLNRVYRFLPCQACIRAGRLIECEKCGGNGYTVQFRKLFGIALWHYRVECTCKNGYVINPIQVRVNKEPPKSPPPPPKTPAEHDALVEKLLAGRGSVTSFQTYPLAPPKKPDPPAAVIIRENETSEVPALKRKIAKQKRVITTLQLDLDDSYDRSHGLEMDLNKARDRADELRRELNESREDPCKFERLRAFILKYPLHLLNKELVANPLGRNYLGELNSVLELCRAIGPRIVFHHCRDANGPIPDTPDFNDCEAIPMPEYIKIAIERGQRTGVVSIPAGEFVLKEPIEIPLWPKPIPVSERLPDRGRRESFGEASTCSKWVLAWCNDWYVAFEQDGRWEECGTGNRLENVTHWLPLPPDVE